MMNEINLLWIVFWIAVSAAWSVLSFQWLKKTVDLIRPPLVGEKPHLGGLIFRRAGVFLMVGLLFYLALKTEPVAAIAMAITITTVTWLQVILYNIQLNKQAERDKEK